MEFRLDASVADVPLVALDRRGRILQWNRAAATVLGWEGSKAPGDIAGWLATQESRHELQNLVATARKAERVQVRVSAPAGGTASLDASLWPDADGQRINLMVRDAPRAGGDMLPVLHAALVESSQDAIITKTLGSIITSWNPAAERLLGYTAAEAIGQSVLMLIPPDLQDEETGILARLRRGERIEHYETIRRRKDGELINVELTISPLRAPGGEIVGASKILRDITGRKRSEQALAEERRNLETLHRVGQALSANLDLEALLQAVTDAATELCGAQFGAFFFNTVDAQGRAYQLVTLSGAPREAFERFGHPRATALFAPTFEGRGVVRSDDVLKDPRYGQSPPHHGLPQGHLPVRSYLAVPVLTRSGKTEGGLFFGHPEPGVFTARHERLIVGLASHASIAVDNARLYESERRARAEAEQLSKNKDEFMATLSHELRTPLNAILGWTSILERGASAADLAKGLEVIRRNVHAQTQLVDDLMDMSRIVTGQMRLDIQSVMPMTFVKGAVDALRPLAEARGIRLLPALDPSAGPVKGDPARLQQVVWNLVANAIKFTPAGGRVQVSLERVNSHIEITVADSGIGIKPEFLPRIFERYRQGDSSITRRHGGLGLGLSIVKHIVDMHNGLIFVKSPGENQGATFRVQLPVAIVHHAVENRSHPRQPGAAPAPHADLSGMRILVVDDEPDACALLQRILEDAGASVHGVRGGAEALAALAAERFEIIVSDIGMPGMDGYELLARIGEQESAAGRQRLPAIALTAFARSEDRTRAMLSGFLAHVSKPVEPAEIIATVASLSGRTGQGRK